MCMSKLPLYFTLLHNTCQNIFDRHILQQFYKLKIKTYKMIKPYSTSSSALILPCSSCLFRCHESASSFHCCCLLAKLPHIYIYVYQAGCIKNNNKLEAPEMTLQLRELPTLAEGSSSVLSTQNR